MKAADRRKAARLDGVLAQYDIWVTRTFQNLADAGYDFASIDEARRRLDFQRRYPGFDQMQLDSVMYRADQVNEHKRKAS